MDRVAEGQDLNGEGQVQLWMRCRSARHVVKASSPGLSDALEQAMEGTSDLGAPNAVSRLKLLETLGGNPRTSRRLLS